MSIYVTAKKYVKMSIFQRVVLPLVLPNMLKSCLNSVLTVFVDGADERTRTSTP